MKRRITYESEDNCLLGYDTRLLTALPPVFMPLFPTRGLLFYSEKGDSKFLQKTGEYLPDCTTTYPEDNILHSHCHESLKSHIYIYESIFKFSSILQMLTVYQS
jgi:hypothetical protein